MSRDAGNGAQAEPAADRRRGVPSVERLVQAIGPCGLPRPVMVDEVRRQLAAIRGGEEPLAFDEVLARTRAALARTRRRRLQPVINATGVVLHTNLGRAPLSAEAVSAVAAVAGGYANLEFDLEDGARGGRAVYLESALAKLCGAEAAAVVNNGAAALVLVVRHYTAERREVVLSRGELVQIGGGFRVPEILEASGAVLREIGTTNQTSLEDYERAIGGETGLVLKVHRSNFAMEGFVSSPSRAALGEMARRRGVPFVEDLGSGAVLATEELDGVGHEPTVGEALREGVDLVLFSGDKLLGGPQAGIIAGRRREVGALKRTPLFRALRCDKLVLTALEATVDAFLRGDATASVPTWRLLRVSTDELRTRAEAIVRRLGGVAVVASIGEGEGEVGAGSLPRARLRSVTVDLQPRGMSLEAAAAQLRTQEPAVIGYVSDGRLKLDLRTVFPEQDEQVIRAVRAVFTDSAEAQEARKA